MPDNRTNRTTGLTAAARVCLPLVLMATTLGAGPSLAQDQGQKSTADAPATYNGMPDQPEAVSPLRRITDFLQITKPQVAQETSSASGSITLLGQVVPPAKFARLSWEPQDTFESLAAPTPVLVLNGRTPGPTLCLTGAVHGDEINGIEIIRQVFFGINPEEIAGVLVGVPIVNQMGFRRASRYLPDRRDLNRYFPGDPRGSSASRIAHKFFNDVIRHCDALVDLHTGSFHRTNVPQLRADMRDERVVQLVHGFGGMIVIHNSGAKGSLRRAALDAGIPTVTMEAGEPMRIQEEVVNDGVERLRTLLSNMGIHNKSFYWSNAKPVYFNSRWVRSEQGGLLISEVDVGSSISKGDILGHVIDPINNVEYPIPSPYNGQVIGMALNQVVMPGYAAYHIGIKATEESLETEPAANGNNPDEEGTHGGAAPPTVEVPEVD